ncbi:MAG: DUF6390 family protein [Patescibacteria group bacterium]|nr:DUF6390 family protein [Patescibacteria group bacterium]
MKKGEILASIYSWGCNRDKELKSSETFRQFIASGEEKFQRKIKDILPKLKPDNCYKIIAAILKIKDPYTPKVIEAYWLGHKLLNVKNSILSHNYTVLNTIAKINPSRLPIQIKNDTENCLISLGRVKKIWKGKSSIKKVAVEYQPLEFGDKISLGKTETKKIDWYPKLLPHLKVNDWISIHYNTARQVLTASQRKSLLKNLEEALKLINTQAN